MIERILFDALNRGLDYLLARPRRLSKFLDGLGLDATEIAALQTYFTTTRPLVKHNYPRTSTARFPSFHIVLGDESEGQHFLNDDGGVLSAEDAEELGSMEYLGSKIIASLSKYEFHILVVDDNPDKVLFLYQVARFCLLHERDWLKEQGLLTQSISGADIAPDPRYMPEHLFVRRLTFSTMAESSILGDRPAAGRISRVEGIHVAGGSSSDNGGVTANVTVSEDDEEE